MSNVATAYAGKSVMDAVEPPAAKQRELTLSELLDTGQFARYHLEKAKAALAAGNLGDAQYQVAASLCHDTLDEAAALKAEINRLSKTG